MVTIIKLNSFFSVWNSHRLKKNIIRHVSTTFWKLSSRAFWEMANGIHVYTSTCSYNNKLVGHTVFRIKRVRDTYMYLCTMHASCVTQRMRKVTKRPLTHSHSALTHVLVHFLACIHCTQKHNPWKNLWTSWTHHLYVIETREFTEKKMKKK